MAATRVVMHQIVLPAEVDSLGICFGGQVRHLRTSTLFKLMLAPAHLQAHACQPLSLLLSPLCDADRSCAWRQDDILERPQDWQGAIDIYASCTPCTQ